jgi:hypothetical protein
VPVEQLPHDVSEAAVRGTGDWLVELPGRAGLQGSDGRAVLRPVRVEVEDLSKLSGGEASVFHLCRRSLA